MTAKLQIVVIGLGKQSRDDHLPAIMQSENFELVGVCDTDQKKAEEIGAQYGVTGYADLGELINAQDFQVAVVSIPHHAYLNVISTLVTAGKHIIKEKPFATSVAETRQLLQILQSGSVYLGVTVQRRFNPIYQTFHQLKRYIGKIYSIEGAYTMNVAVLDEGWRVLKNLSGGGALVDMGCHFIDLLIWYFGVPASVTARMTRGNRPGQKYNVEDTVHLLFDYHLEFQYDEKLVGNFVISRVYPEKQERVRVFGTNGIFSSGCKRIKRDRISFILSNPFYIGLFRYAGEVHEGKHQPIVSKKIFDRAQEVLKQRGRPRRKAKNEPKAFCGLLSCAECRMGITAESPKGHTYYHCTKKRGNCSQPYVREEELNRQLSQLLQKFSLRPDWAAEMRKMLEQDKIEAAQSATAFVQEAREKVRTIETKLQRLLDGYLEQVIEQETYRSEKVKLLSEKKSLEEQITNFEQKRIGWLEPMAEWIKEAESLPKIAQESNLFLKKVAAEKLFGSNLVLANREARVSTPNGEENEPKNQ